VVSVKPRDYCIVVEGELGPRYAVAFEPMRLDAHDGTTEIIGRIQDDAELRGLLDQVANLGLSLVSVAPVEDPGDDRDPGRLTDADSAYFADSPG
jgi:hypothetical protein